MKSDLSDLTNDSKFLLSSMYKIYLERRKSKMDKKDARFFGNIHDINNKIMNEWTEADILDTCFELRSKGYINAIAGNNNLARISITTDSIARLEVTFKDRLDSVIDYAAKIKGLIPFI